MSEEKKEIRKLTGEDLPELKETEPAPEQMYCRFFKETWSGWQETSCSANYSDENSCAYAAQSAGADGYAWTGKSC